MTALAIVHLHGQAFGNESVLIDNGVFSARLCHLLGLLLLLLLVGGLVHLEYEPDRPGVTDGTFGQGEESFGAKISEILIGDSSNSVEDPEIRVDVIEVRDDPGYLRGSLDDFPCICLIVE